MANRQAAMASPRGMADLLMADRVIAGRVMVVPPTVVHAAGLPMAVIPATVLPPRVMVDQLRIAQVVAVITVVARQVHTVVLVDIVAVVVDTAAEAEVIKDTAKGSSHTLFF